MQMKLSPSFRPLLEEIEYTPGSEGNFSQVRQTERETGKLSIRHPEDIHWIVPWKTTVVESSSLGEFGTGERIFANFPFFNFARGE